MGRPPIPVGLRRDKRLVVMLTGAETEAYSEAARLAGVASLSEWVRALLDDAARKEARKKQT